MWVVVTQNIFSGPKTESKPFERKEDAMRHMRMWQTTRPMWAVSIKEVKR